jgi:hypothetical protein
MKKKLSVEQIVSVLEHDWGLMSCTDVREAIQATVDAIARFAHHSTR